MKRTSRALVAGFLLTIGLTGCARGSDDMWDRAGLHMERHVKNFYNQLVRLHQDTDNYFFDVDEWDPDINY